MNYVTYMPDGSLDGGYFQDLQPVHTNCYIEVTEAQRLSWPIYRANAARDGLEPAPPLPQSVEQFNAPILAALASIDAKSIRALREGDAARIASLESQAAALRLQLRKD